MFYKKHFMNSIKRIFFSLVIVLLCIAVIPAKNSIASQKKENKTVRVGYYENDKFQYGASENRAKGGYSYEYLQRLRMYTGWEFEYVYGTFGEIYEALLNGDVDIMAGLAYSDERSSLMLYPMKPMGNTPYYLVKKNDNNEITTEPGSLNGKTIGTLQGAMEKVVEIYAIENDIELNKIVYSDFSERDVALVNGEVDVILVEAAATDAKLGITTFKKVGGNDYYITVNKERKDILFELNKGQEALFAAYPEIADELYEKWFKVNVASSSLTKSEEKWLSEHESLKIGYFDDFLPYCDRDQDGNVSGVLVDVMDKILENLNITDLSIEYVCYDTSKELLQGLQTGEVDCIFPVYANYYADEKYDIMPTNEVISAYLNMVYRDTYPNLDKDVLAMPNASYLISAFVDSYYPDINMLYFENSQASLDAVAAGKADFTFVSGLNSDTKLREKDSYKALKVAQYVESAELGFGVNYDSAGTLEILNHGISLLDENYALQNTYKYSEEYKPPFFEIIKDNAWIVATILLVVVGSILAAVINALRRERKHAKAEKEQQIKLEEALYEAKRANAAKTMFLSRMSHDIRTPLNGIIGLLEISEAHADDYKMIQENRDKAKVAANHLLSLINNVLEISKLSDDSVTLTEEAFNLHDLVSEVMTLVKFEAQESGINLICQDYVYEMKFPFVYGSPLYIRQIFLNVLSNSVKYNNPGGMINFSVELSDISEELVKYRFLISDTGIGMSEDFITHLFEPFAQEHHDVKSIYHGTGLGMSIVKSLVDKMNGEIKVKSKPGKGTNFEIILPFKIAEKTEIAKNKRTDSTYLKGKRILLVEDNELNLEIAETLLKDMGVEVTSAMNGKMAVDIFNASKAGTFDAILMDLMMPEMNGYEATTAIRSINRKDNQLIPIIAMTANAFAEDVKSCLEAGMNNHIAKPIDRTTMINKLSEEIEKYHSVKNKA